MTDPDDTVAASQSVILRRDVIRQGNSDAAIRRAVRDNAIERVWWGSYVPVTSSDSGAIDARAQRYREMIEAAVRTGTSRRHLSHQSAAMMLGIPLLQADMSTVHFVSGSTGRSSPGLVIHHVRLTPDDLVEVDGIAMTSIGRTVCDVARMGTFRQAVCALDSGLFQARSRGVVIDLEAVVAAMGRLHGMPMLRAALPHATAASASIGESLSRAQMIEDARLPLPELQVEVILADGSVKWCDFGWRDSEGRLRVVGEFDGRVKYHRQSAASGHRLAEDVIYAEKLREDAIRDCDVIVVRWTWADLMRPAAFIRKLEVALRRAGLID